LDPRCIDRFAETWVLDIVIDRR